MGFDVHRVRAEYPALRSATVFLDGAAGTQSPTCVIEAVAEAYRQGLSNGGGVFASSRRADELTAAAREAVTDLVNAPDPAGVLLGPNMTTLTYRLAATLSRLWLPGDNVVVSRLDHDANVRPWVQWAERAGAQVRWAEVELPSGELPAEQYETLVDDRTRLVAVTAASNVLGTRPDVGAITAIARSRGALAYVDGVHATAHGVVDMQQMGADLYATSAYKWTGPHVGAVAADPSLLVTLHPDKLASSSDDVPERFEWGTPSFHSFAGLAAAVDHLARLDDAAVGSRRERLVRSLAAAEEYEQALLAEMLGALESMPSVVLYGAPRDRTATVYLNVAGRSPLAVAEHLAAHGINAWHGHNYAWEVTAALGIRESGSAVRVSLAHYTTRADVARLLEALRGLG